MYLSLRELAEALVKHFDFHEGLYNLSIELRFAAGQVGPTADSVLPGAMVGISQVGLVEATEAGPNTVDASKINPAKAAKTPGIKKATPKKAASKKPQPK